MSGYSLKKLINEREARITVLGLGYVGLPLAVALARSGFLVQGLDISSEKVEQLNSGHSPVMDVLSKSIQEYIYRNFFVDDNFSAISSADVVIICVPTPLNEAREPDLSCIIYAVNEIKSYLRKKTLLILESTTYPGTTEELIINVIENENNWVVGKDFFVCCSPERVDPGNKSFDITNTPKVIGGATPWCLSLGTELYGSIVEQVVPVSSTRIAEMVKLLENTFRGVNIAMINEMAQMADRMDINIWEVIKAASTKPFGFMPFYPGPGIGGHCIPLDPVYLLWKAKAFNHYNRFIELASDINANMPEYVVQQIAEILNDKGKSIKDSSILLLGLAYKKDVDDLRESPALRIFSLLDARGARLSYFDPYLPSFAYGDQIFYSCELVPKTLEDLDLVVITTDHSDVDYEFIVHHAPLIFDTKNATRSLTGDNIHLLGGQKKSSSLLEE